MAGREKNVFLFSLLPQCLKKLRHGPLFSPCASCASHQGGEVGAQGLLLSVLSRSEPALGWEARQVGISALPCEVRTQGTCSPAVS